MKKAILAGTIIALGLSVLIAFQYKTLKDELNFTNEANQSLLARLESEVDKSNYLLEKNREQQSIITAFGGQIESLGSTVGDLEKLAKTDEELLRKYSKVYFLNENYIPKPLIKIPKGYTYTKEGNYYFHGDVWPHLKDLLDRARRDDIDIVVASAYRSFDTQEALKTSYVVQYGSGANQFSADQGYSEHQLGTSIDFTTEEIGGVFSQFEDQEAYDWLLKNAHQYGFTLSYPEGNSYYKFEPWHWRYVGLDLAKFLYNERLDFYDVSQREIDSYLIRFFD